MLLVHLFSVLIPFDVLVVFFHQPLNAGSDQAPEFEIGGGSLSVRGPNSPGLKPLEGKEASLLALPLNTGTSGLLSGGGRWLCIGPDPSAQGPNSPGQ